MSIPVLATNRASVDQKTCQLLIQSEESSQDYRIKKVAFIAIGVVVLAIAGTVVTIAMFNLLSSPFYSITTILVTLIGPPMLLGYCLKKGVEKLLLEFANSLDGLARLGEFFQKRDLNIRSLHPLFQTPFDSSKPFISLIDRKEELRKRLEETLYSKGWNRSNELVLRHYKEVFPLEAPAAGENCIIVPLFTFLCPQEFPLELQVYSLDDPKLLDDAYFTKVSDWACNAFGIPKKEISWKDKQSFKLYLRFMQNSEMAKRGTLFFLHHELGHIFHKHSQDLSFTSLLVVMGMSILVGGAGIWLASLLAGLICAFTAGTVSYVAAKSMSSRAHEQEADRMAFQSTGDADGGIYLFEKIKEQQAEACNSTDIPWYAKIFITPSGDCWPRWFTHGCESDRIAILQSAKAAKLFSH